MRSRANSLPVPETLALPAMTIFPSFCSATLAAVMPRCRGLKKVNFPPTPERCPALRWADIAMMTAGSPEPPPVVDPTATMSPLLCSVRALHCWPVRKPKYVSTRPLVPKLGSGAASGEKSSDGKEFGAIARCESAGDNIAAGVDQHAVEARGAAEELVDDAAIDAKSEIERPIGLIACQGRAGRFGAIGSLLITGDYDLAIFLHGDGVDAAADAVGLQSRPIKTEGVVEDAVGEIACQGNVTGLAVCVIGSNQDNLAIGLKQPDGPESRAA